MHYATGAEGRILTMIDYGKIKTSRVFHRPAHHSRIGNWPSVIGDCDYACILHLAHLSQLPAATAFGNGADRKHIGQPGCFTLLNYEARDSWIVVDGVGIRHRTNAGPTPCHRSC